MKKILAILLASALLVSVLAVIAIPAIADEAKPFWVTHYNDLTAEGAGVIVTDATDLTGGSWNNYYAFSPIEGTDAYEITAVSIGIGTGAAALPAVPAGGFVYSINVGNNYPELDVLYPNQGYAGQPNYTSDNCNNMVADVATWAVGNKFTFVGLDLEGLTVPTSTAGTNWYDASYVCTATYSVYVAEGEESTSVDDEPVIPDSYGATVDPATGNYTFENAYGHEFTINYVDGVIAGEDATLITNENAYASCNPNWAISVVLVATDVANEYTVDSVVVTPGNATSVDWSACDAVLVVHSADSKPEGLDWTGTSATFPNWMSKVAACALKNGDVITVNADQTLAVVSAPVVDEESSEAESSEEESSEAESSEEESSEAESSEEESSEEESSDVVAEGDFTVDLEATGDLTVGSTVTVVVSVNNITTEKGLHLVKFQLDYDPSVLLITTDLDETDNNCLMAMTTVPTENWENFCKVNYTFDEDTEIATAKNDGIVYLSALTDQMLKSQAAQEDGSIVFTVTFEVIAEAESTVISVNDPIDGAYNTSDGVDKYVGVGSELTLPVVEDDDSSEAESSEAESSEAESSEEESSEAESSEVESSEAESSEEDSDTVDGDELVGEPNADAQFDVDLAVEGDLTVGSTVTVTATINNITAERGLHLVKFQLNYDPSVLLITNDLDESDNNCLMAMTTVPTDNWENFCKVNYTFDEDTEIATAKNDGIVYLSALTNQTLKSQAAKDDGSIVFTVTFEVIGEATKTVLYTPNANIEGASNTSDDIVRFAGNGSYVTVISAQDDTTSDVESSDVESSEAESSEAESSEAESSEAESSEAESSEDDSSNDSVDNSTDTSDESGDDVSGDATDESGDEVSDETSDESGDEVSDDASDESVESDVESSDAATESSKDDSSAGTPQTGDVSSMIVFVVLALVALAGSAVVIKTRK